MMLRTSLSEGLMVDVKCKRLNHGSKVYLAVKINPENYLPDACLERFSEGVLLW